MKKILYILSSLFILVSCGPTELTEDEKNLLNQLTEEIQSDYRNSHATNAIFLNNESTIEKYITKISEQKNKEAQALDWLIGDYSYLTGSVYDQFAKELKKWEEYCETRNEIAIEVIEKVVMDYNNISNNYTDQMLNSLGLIENGKFSLSKQKLNDICKFLYKDPDKIQNTDGSDIHKYFEPIIIASLREYTPPVVIKTEYVYEEEGWLVEYSFGDSYLVKFYEDEENGVLHMKYEPVEVEVIY